MKHFGVNQGLPSTECYYTMQDSRGYLWVATDAGVAKYDGYKFTTYDGAKGLPDNAVFKIHEDSRGRIWFSTYSGRMAYYAYQTDSIYGIPINSKLDNTIKYFPVDFCFDDADTLYLSLFKKGYVKIYPPDYKNMETFFPGSSMYYVKRIGKKNVIYGHAFIDSLLVVKHYASYKVPDKTFFPVYDLSRPDAPRVLSPVLGIDGHECCIMYDSLLLFSCGGGIINISNGVELSKNTDYVDTNHVISMYQDHRRYLWLSRLTKGVYTYKGLDLSTAAQHLLPNLSVTSVYEDSDHGYWLSTLENGLYYIPSLEFNYLGTNSGASSDKILSIAFRGNELYVLDADFILSQRDAATMRLINSEQLPTSTWHLGESDSSLLICRSYSFILKPGGQKVFLNNMSLGENPLLKVKKAIAYGPGFLAFNDGYIFTIDQATGCGKPVIRGLPRIFSIHYLDSTIWIGTKSGLYSYKHGALHFHGHDDKLLNYRIEDIASAGDTLFLATRGQGLLCLHHNRVIGRYTEADGLASNMLKCLYMGSRGDIWIGTNRGISRLKHTGRRFTVKTLDISNGLISNEVNQIIEHGQKLYVATNGGLEVINTSGFYNINAPIPVYIEKFHVNTMATPILGPHELSYDQNFINITYRGISVKSEGDIRYKYRLEGLDTAWTQTKNTFVQYTTLPPGQYKFTVYAVNNDGNLSAKPAVISFVIDKPFWGTWWFRALCAAIVCAAAWIIYRRRVKVIQQREQEKAEISRRISESELKALRAQMNPHFMFNAINSIQNFVLKNDAGSAQKYLTKFARLIRSVLENSKYETVTLKKEIDSLRLYIELEALRASFGFDYEIAVEQNVDEAYIRIPPMIIQPYIENAILHGLMPLTGRKGRLSVKFTREGDTLLCTIDDNGIGRAKAEEIKRRKQLSHQSMGMSVTHDRISILNQHRHTLSAKVSILDKIINGIAEGTTIEISINIKKHV